MSTRDFGDLLGVLKFGGQGVVLNNHDGFSNTFGSAPIVYDDTAAADRPLGTTNTDGPGSLLNFRGRSSVRAVDFERVGRWRGRVHRPGLAAHAGHPAASRFEADGHLSCSLPPGGWFIDWVDVPAGCTNLTFYATNVTVGLPVGTPPIQMYEKFGSDPTAE